MRYLYFIWAILVYGIVLLKDGFDEKNITHIAIGFFLLITLTRYSRRTKEEAIQNPRRFFILRATFFAAIVEAFYMISEPLFPSLKITSGMDIRSMFLNLGIDLAFTIPAYIAIFSVTWWLINKYAYTRWEYFFLFALGQALGDGNGTFLFQPALLIFIPYVMLNYHAMNIEPFLRIERYLPAHRAQGMKRIILPLVLLPLTYLLCGGLIFLIAGILGAR